MAWPKLIVYDGGEIYADDPEEYHEFMQSLPGARAGLPGGTRTEAASGPKRKAQRGTPPPQPPPEEEFYEEEVVEEEPTRGRRGQRGFASSRTAFGFESKGERGRSTAAPRMSGFSYTSPRVKAMNEANSRPADEELSAAFWPLGELKHEGAVKAYRSLFYLLGKMRGIAPNVNQWAKPLYGKEIELLTSRGREVYTFSLLPQELFQYLGVSPADAVAIMAILADNFPESVRVSKNGFFSVPQRQIVGEEAASFLYYAALMRDWPAMSAMAKDLVDDSIARTSGYSIPFEGKLWSDWTRGAKQNPFVNWTAYPQAAYETYYRTNPAVEVPQPTNGGPYLPQMFPYGQGGRVYDYEEASPNPRTRSRRPRGGRKKR